MFDMYVCMSVCDFYDLVWSTFVGAKEVYQRARLDLALTLHLG